MVLSYSLRGKTPLQLACAGWHIKCAQTVLPLLNTCLEVRCFCCADLAAGEIKSVIWATLQGWNKQWDEWVEQDGLHKFKKELLDVRLDGGETSAQGTADAKRVPSPPSLPRSLRLHHLMCSSCRNNAGASITCRTAFHVCREVACRGTVRQSCLWQSDGPCWLISSACDGLLRGG